MSAVVGARVRLRVARSSDLYKFGLHVVAQLVATDGQRALQRCVLAFDDDQLVGFAAIRRCGDLGVLVAVEVGLDWQGHGIGSLLVGQCVINALFDGAACVIAVPGQLQEFLSHCGFGYRNLSAAISGSLRSQLEIAEREMGKVMCCPSELSQ